MKPPDPGNLSTAGKAGPPRLRFLLLFLLFLVVAGAGLTLRGEELQAWWLNRQSLASIRNRVTREDASPLARDIYAEKVLLTGDADAALKAYQDAARHLPPGASDGTAEHIYAHLGYLLARLGNTKEALKVLTQARSLNDYDSMVHLGLGIVFADQKNLSFTETQFKMATTLDPKNVEAWFRLGQAYIEVKNPEAAIPPLKQAIALVPQDAASHHLLGTAYALQSHFGDAVIEFRRAESLAPSNRDYRVALGSAEAMNAHTPEQFHGAAELLEQALRDDPSDEYTEFALGLLDLRFNALAEAQKHLSHCVQLRPEDAQAHYDLALAEQRLGHAAAYNQAMAQFHHLTDVHDTAAILEKRVGASPRDPALRIQLARAYQDTGNVVGVYWQLKTALDLNSTQPGLQQQVSAAHERMKAAGNLHVEFLPGSPITPGPPPPEALEGNVPSATPAPQTQSSPVPSAPNFGHPQPTAGR